MADMKCYACINKDETVRINSSSGGVFSVMAEKVLSENGIVYGVRMSEDCYSAEFDRVDSADKLYVLRGSKYLQAHIGLTYLRVKEDLDNNKLVLFTGTICQVNALKKFLGREYENLICVDVVCHGVPSPKLWRSYLKSIEKKRDKIHTVNFRSKRNGWADYGLLLNQSYSNKGTNPYLQMFLKDYCLRPSCYNCRAKEDKKSDASIADFWGIESICKDLSDDKGTSLVIVRTEKGQSFFDRIKDQLLTHEVSYEDAKRKNPAEYKSAHYPEIREQFFQDMNTLSFEQLARKYSPSKPIKIMKKHIMKCIHRIIVVVHRR